MHSLILAGLLFAQAAPNTGSTPHPGPREVDVWLLPQPERIYDTRVWGCQIAIVWPDPAEPVRPCPVGELQNGETRYTQFQAQYPIVPFPAKGVLLTVSVVDPTEDGHLTLYDPYPVFDEFPSEKRPRAASIIFAKGVRASSQVTLHLGQWQLQTPGTPYRPDSAIFARLDGLGGGSVHVVIDVVGYLK